MERVSFADGQGGRDMPGKRAAFPRQARLLRHADFERVYKEGRRHFASQLTVFYRLRSEGSGFRVGFTVGKVLGGAVDRNRIKRRLREAVRLHWREAAAPVDVVIHPKKTVLKMDFRELGEQIDRAFDVIGKFSESNADKRERISRSS